MGSVLTWFINTLQMCTQALVIFTKKYLIIVCISVDDTLLVPVSSVTES
jgi:hypothetical protein